MMIQMIVIEPAAPGNGLVRHGVRTRDTYSSSSSGISRDLTHLNTLSIRGNPLAQHFDDAGINMLVLPTALQLGGADMRMCGYVAYTLMFVFGTECAISACSKGHIVKREAGR